MKRTLFCLVSLSFALILARLPNAARAANFWYVSPSGSDGNTCASPASPCFTIQAVLAKTGSGDSLYLAAGEYRVTPVTLDKNVTLLGGWNNDFTVQVGRSRLTVYPSGRVILINPGVSVQAEYLELSGGSHSDTGGGGGLLNKGTAILRHSRVTNNRIFSYYGGNGIANQGVLTLEDCEIDYNGFGGEDDGGGIFSNPGSSLTIRRSSIHHNGGSGLRVYGANVLIADSSFANNDAQYDSGGGIWMSGAPDFKAANTAIINNKGTKGGGIYVSQSSYCTAPGGCFARLDNVTVSGNQSWQGGGIYVADGKISLHHSLLADNRISGQDAQGPDCWGSSTGIVSAGYNLVENTQNCALSPQTGDLLNQSAHLALQVSREKGFSFAPLQATSPAIDAGDPSGCASGDGQPILYDVRGAARSGKCDLGAFEYTLPGPAATWLLLQGTPQVTATNHSFGSRLVVRALDSLGSPTVSTPLTFQAPVSGPSAIFTDTGSSSTTVLSNLDGVITSSQVLANDLPGSYVITASEAVSHTAILTFTMRNVSGYYVAPNGSDANDCESAATACANLKTAVDKALPGMSIAVAAGTYHTTVSPYTGVFETIKVGKPLTITGGWNAGFTAQTGLTILDWQHKVMTLEVQDQLSLDRFWIRDGNQDGTPAVYCTNGAHLVFTRGAITGGFTSRTDGSGLLLSHCEVVLENVTIANNIAQGLHFWSYRPLRGGGIYIDNEFSQGPSRLSMFNVTIFGNRSDEMGGGLSNPGNSPVEMTNTILAGNSSASGPDCYGPLSSHGYSLLGEPDGCSFTSAAGDLQDIDARLLDSGEQLGWVIPMQDSPVLDAGDPAGCLSHLGTSLAEDQRGRPRVGRCDLGAYERQPSGPAVEIYAYGGTSQRTGPNTTFARPLQALAVDAQGEPAAGLTVVFTAPASGPSLTFAGTGSNTVSISTDGNGLATTPPMMAGLKGGVYLVEAAAAGLGKTVKYSLGNIRWYLSPAGSDAKSCLDPSTPCLSLAGVLDEPLFAAGDQIWMSQGTYQNSTENAVFTLGVGAQIVGGWNPGFTAVVGRSILDGQASRYAMLVANYYTDQPKPVVTLENLELINGKSANLYIENGEVSLQNCLVRSATGMGIANAGGSVTLRDTIVRDIQGTGIVNGTSSDSFKHPVMEIWNSAIISNTVKDLGRAAGINNSAVLYLNNSTVSNNRGVYMSWGSTAGIINFGPTLKISSSTITANRSDGDTGGLLAFKPVEIKNSILAGNEGKKNVDCSGSLTSGGYNVLGEIQGCEVTLAAGDQTDIWDLRIAPLANNGGPSLTHALYAGSPAIDGGNPAGCTDHTGARLLVDQRGRARSMDGDNRGGERCDIGALESSYPPPAGPIKTTWYVSRNGKDTGTCSTPAQPCKTIPAALSRANPLDVIKIAAGSYTAPGGTEVLQVAKHIILSGGWSEDFTLPVGQTTLDGQSARRAITIPAGIKVQLERFNLINGKGAEGGAIQAGEKARLMLTGCSLSGNRSTLEGGAIDLGANSILIVYNTEFRSNSSPQVGGTGNGGGAVHAGGSNFIKIYDSILDDNQALNGGAIVLPANDQLYLYNTSLTNNRANWFGGALDHFQSKVFIYDSLIAGNKAVYGGGLSGSGTSEIYLERTTLSQNVAVTNGGAVNGPVLAVSSAMIANQATKGGAIYGTPVLKSVTLHSNLALAEGGAIYYTKDGPLSLFNCTLAYNHSDGRGGGIFVYPQPKSFPDLISPVSHTVLWGNTATIGPDCFGALPSGEYNLFGTLSGCSVTPSATDRVGVNPLLPALASGSLTPYLWPRESSPLVDGGAPTCPTLTDQRGAVRPLDGNRDGLTACDIGAIETGGSLYLPVILKSPAARPGEADIWDWFWR